MLSWLKKLTNFFQSSNMSRTYFPFQMEREAEEVQTCCSEHDDVHEIVLNIVKQPLDFTNQDVYEVINVLTDTSRETVHCNQETSVLELLLCVQSALRLSCCMKENTEEKLQLLETIYETLKHIPLDYYIEDLCKQYDPSCLLTCEIYKIIMKIVDFLSSSSNLKPFVGSFDVFVKEIETGQYSYKEYIGITFLHNISAHLMEIYNERRYKQWNIINDKEVFYVNSPKEMTRPLSGLPKFVLKKIVKDKLVKVSTIHVCFFNFFSHLPKYVQKEWIARVNTKTVDMPTKCCVCLDLEPFKSDSSLGYLSGCPHVICLDCLEELCKRNKELTCPLCRIKSVDFICKAGFSKLMQLKLKVS